MKNLKNNIMKNKKTVVIVGVIALLLIGVGGYFIYDNNRKNEIRSKMDIVFTELAEVEYGTKDFDVKKELISEVKNSELTGDLPEIDTSKIGETKLVFTLTKSDVTKEIEHTIKVVDTKGPEITLEADSKELTVGDEYDFMSNITSVKDLIDGDIDLNKDASDVNKKANEEYNKLKKEEITDETKVADKDLKEFFIETTKSEDDEKETTTLFLKNCYYVDGTVDSSVVGEYKINIIAVDKNGVKTTKEFTVTVKEKEPEPTNTNSNGGNGSYASSGGNYSNNGSSNGGGSSSYVGSKSDIINLALAQVGKTYQLNASGPNAFDCSGLIYYAYTQNGWSIPRRVSSGGSRLSSYAELQPGDIIYMPSQNHVALFIGGDQMVEALNPQQGILISSTFFIPGDAQFIRY